MKCGKMQAFFLFVYNFSDIYSEYEGTRVFRNRESALFGAQNVQQYVQKDQNGR